MMISRIVVHVSVPRPCCSMGVWPMVLHHGGVVEMLQHLFCSYPAVAMVDTNMVANRV